LAKPKKAVGKKKKAKKVDVAGIVHIKSSFNNTIITITDQSGAVVAWASPGTMGFKGSRKSTPFAAQQAAGSCAREVLDMGMKKVEAWIKGPGAGREAAIRSLRAAGLEVTAVKDNTPMPHNGVRLKKRRRV
jgi:small subunit ribosomal protein S11